MKHKRYLFEQRKYGKKLCFYLSFSSEQKCTRQSSSNVLIRLISLSSRQSDIHSHRQHGGSEREKNIWKIWDNYILTSSNLAVLYTIWSHCLKCAEKYAYNYVVYSHPLIGHGIMNCPTSTFSVVSNTFIWSYGDSTNCGMISAHLLPKFEYRVWFWIRWSCSGLHQYFDSITPIHGCQTNHCYVFDYPHRVLSRSIALCIGKVFIIIYLLKNASKIDFIAWQFFLASK